MAESDPEPPSATQKPVPEPPTKEEALQQLHWVGKSADSNNVERRSADRS